MGSSFRTVGEGRSDNRISKYCTKLTTSSVAKKEKQEQNNYFMLTERSLLVIPSEMSHFPLLDLST
jgi:hypothetical protein